MHKDAVFCSGLWIFELMEKLCCACRTLKIGNKKCSLQPLIGCPFGSLFQVESGKEGTFLTRFVENAEGILLI